MKQSKLFHDFMVAVWDNAILDRDGNDMYDEYHDANTIAETMGGRRTANDKNSDDGDEPCKWLFPDGSTAMIQRNGNGIH